jgi:putative colanic acid biosynthesis glycosyltransferase WcaI
MGAPAARVSAMARRWVALGNRVTVVTAFPNHPTGEIPDRYRGMWRLEEDDAGVRLRRAFIYPAPNRGVWLRSLSYASFAVSSVTEGYLVEERPDVVVATSPQFLVAMSGWSVSRLKGAPLVVEIRDLWPDSIAAVGALPPDSLALRGLRVAERFVYRQADLVVSVTHSFVDHIRANGGRRVVVIPNGADPEVFRPIEDTLVVRRRYGLGSRFVACFAGTIGMAHGLETVLEAAEILRDDGRFLFWLVGDGARRAELEREAQRRGLGNVRFEGQVSREEVPKILATSDVALVLLKPDPLFETVLPSKMFEAMAAGRPVILGVGGEARRLLEESGGGVPIRPGDAAALVEAVRSLASQPEGAVAMGSRGREFVLRRYAHDALARRYLEELQLLLESSSR